MGSIQVLGRAKGLSSQAAVSVSDLQDRAAWLDGIHDTSMRSLIEVLD